jgi:hypothetical protein
MALDTVLEKESFSLIELDLWRRSSVFCAYHSEEKNNMQRILTTETQLRDDVAWYFYFPLHCCMFNLFDMLLC